MYLVLQMRVSHINRKPRSLSNTLYTKKKNQHVYWGCLLKHVVKHINMHNINKVEFIYQKFDIFLLSLLIAAARLNLVPAKQLLVEHLSWSSAASLFPFMWVSYLLTWYGKQDYRSLKLRIFKPHSLICSLVPIFNK